MYSVIEGGGLVLWFCWRRGEGGEGGGAEVGGGSGRWGGEMEVGGGGGLKRERTEDVTLVVLSSFAHDFEGALGIGDVRAACIGRIPALVPSSQSVPASVIRLAAQPP